MPLNDVALNLPELKQFNHPLYKYCPHALMKDEWDSRIKNREKAVVNAGQALVVDSSLRGK